MHTVVSEHLAWLAALALASLGSVTFLLGSAQQRVLRKPLPTWVATLATVAAFAGAVWILTFVLSVLAAVFVATMLMMTLCSALPFVTSTRQRSRERAA